VRRRRSDDQDRILSLRNPFDDGQVSGMAEFPVSAYRTGGGARAAGFKRERYLDTMPLEYARFGANPCDALEGSALCNGRPCDR
jgi:hypothetical protein